MSINQCCQCQETAELCAFIGYLQRIAMTTHGLSSEDVGYDFVRVLTENSDMALLLEVLWNERLFGFACRFEPTFLQTELLLPRLRQPLRIRVPCPIAAPTALEAKGFSQLIGQTLASSCPGSDIAGRETGDYPNGESQRSPRAGPQLANSRHQYETWNLILSALCGEP